MNNGKEDNRNRKTVGRNLLKTLSRQYHMEKKKEIYLQTYINVTAGCFIMQLVCSEQRKILGAKRSADSITNNLCFAT